jgi:putative ABC transport system permease protein
MVDAVTATPEYFAALGIRLRAGRLFTDADTAGHPEVMVLTSTTARQVFGDQDPIGRDVHLPRLTDDGQDNVAVTVVGVIDDVKYSGLDTPSNGVIFRPFAQQPWASMFIVARTETEDAHFVATLRKTISTTDPSLAIHSIDTLDALVSNEVALPRLRTGVLASLAAIVLALAGLGLYGVVAYAVTQRTSEIGIRMALGADQFRIARLVAIDGLRLVGCGVVMGSTFAWLAARTLTSFLFGVAPTDPWSFVSAIAVVCLVMAAATFVPARRAMRIEPVVALRAE